MEKRIAICPGSFDPITKGHLDIIRRAANLFDEVIVLIMVNYTKTNTAFTPEERVEMARRVTADIPNVRVDYYAGLLADYARKQGACTLVKGLRAVTDFEYEFQMALTNKKLCPNLETLFLTTDIQYMYLSSSVVRQVASFGGDISEFVCPELLEDILGYLYDENLDPQDMPIVRYILYQLIFPKLDEEREQALAVGVYKENSASQDGGAASDALDCMDGYVTQLKALKTASNKKVTWLLDGETLSTDGEALLAQIDKAVDQVKPLYRKKSMFVHADPDLVIRYSRAYREKYPWLKNQDGEKVKIDFTNFTFAPLEGMRGTGVFFITPKENFKHLMSKDPQRTSIRMETNHYNVDIMAEWWEACGFWLAEAIFAYIPPTEAGGDDPESSQGGGV